MVDLKLSCGLPILFDENTEKFHYGEDLVFSCINRIPIASMLPGLLNKSLKYPQNVYLEHKNICNRLDKEILDNSFYNFDLLMLPAGLIGVEFIRSHIYFVPESDSEKLSEIVEVHSGYLTVLLQKNMPKRTEYDFETRVSEGLVVKVNIGEKFLIPRGYYYTFINTKEAPVVLTRFYNKSCMCDYSKMKREQGLAYFAIRKNAKQEIVLNPKYKDIPPIKSLRAKEFEHDLVSSIAGKTLYDSMVINIKERI